jgi:vitamin B12 transporter
MPVNKNGRRRGRVLTFKFLLLSTITVLPVLAAKPSAAQTAPPPDQAPPAQGQLGPVHVAAPQAKPHVKKPKPKPKPVQTATPSTTPAPAPAEGLNGPPDSELVVTTATGRPEPISHLTGTVQVITQQQIEDSKAKSIADLLAENAVGFMSEWSADQTQIVIRGALSEGQGRDYKSEVLVLINGHRAGTANIAKLSVADIDRIEIIRGPSSVVYGSQNMGGIINIIYKTGRTAPGTLVEGAAGSSALAATKGQTGGQRNGVDWYAGLNYGTEDSFHAATGLEQNTGWKRHGETASVGYQMDPNNRVDFNIRQDGIYDAGFRGSSWSLNDQDNRYNGSMDASLTGGTANNFAHWFFQFYDVEDVDGLNQPSPFSAAVNPHTSIDLNTRKQYLQGTRFQPRFDLWYGNDLLLGWDYERETLRSTRFDYGIGVPVPQLAPTDNNQHENVNAYYFEDSQNLFDDRLTVRGGLRKTIGATTLDPTPVVSLATSTHDYQALTYSGGAAYRVTNWLTARLGASTGFRAPTATEFGQNFTTASTGSVTFGNPGINPEHSEQVEAGLNATGRVATLDVAVYQNRIIDRITTQAIGMTPTGGTISQYINNPGAVILQGVELQYQLDVLKLLSSTSGNWFWNIHGDAYYNFHMEDEGITTVVGPTANTDKPLRTYESQIAINTKFGQHGEAFHDWSFEIQGIINGRMWYNTEERLLVPGQVPNVTIFEKSPYTVWNLKGEMKVYEGVSVWGKVNNVFNLNYQPIFIALYGVVPCLGNPAFSNGSCGNSLPGREYIAGLTARF